MSMKKSDLDKNLGMKISGKMKTAVVPDRFTQSAAAAVDKREQRKRDSAAGLVPFACKLPGDLVRRLHDRAVGFEGGLNALVTAALTKAVA